MNANLKRVRDAIAAAPETMIDMATTGNPGCGAPGCIMGWAWTFLGEPDLDADEPFDDTYPKLGLTKKQGDNLCLGLPPIPVLDELEITKDEVLTAIDSLLVDPSRAMPAWPARVVKELEDWS